MAPKRMKRVSNKKGHKMSITKLSNKRLNKLAKQGKLKKKLSKHKLIELAQRRTGCEPDTRPVEAKADVEDIPLDDTDFEFFGSNTRDLGFLSSVQESNVNEKRRGKKRKENTDDMEATYEQEPRKINRHDEKQMKPVLPIKDKKGIIPQTVQMQQEFSDHKEHRPDKDVAKPDPLPVLSTAELLHLRQLKIETTKQRIAVLASSLIEQPEEKIGKLKELRLMLTETDPDVFITVRRLAVASLLEVFKDIIPGYRIRQQTQKEKQQSMKKETKQLRDFEEILISNYRQYLEFLETVIKGKPPKTVERNKWKRQLCGMNLPKEASKMMHDLAVNCLCELLLTHPHFNYRTNIVAIIVPFMDNKNNQISNHVCEAIKKLYKEDKTGDVTLEAVRLTSKLIKNRRFTVQPKVLETFLSLKVKEVLKPGDDAENKKDNKQSASRREKKRQKQMKHLEKELTDAAVMDDKKFKLRMNTQIIEAVFLTYFRILKFTKRSILLSTVLQGLAKFAHLINIDFFEDLFSVLNELVESETLTYRESLHCVQTACTILTGQGSSLNIDPLRFYKHLYNKMFHLHAGMSSVDVPIVLESMELLINKRRRQISLQRLLAFMKRTATLALSLTPGGTLGCLSVLRSFLSLNSKTDLLFDWDSQGSGIFMPELEEPEHCNAHNTVLYELHLLRNYYHPTVRLFTKHVLKEGCNMSNQAGTSLHPELSRRSPVELYHDHDTNHLEFEASLESLEKPNVKKRLQKPRYSMVQEEFQEELDRILNSVEGIR